VKAPEAIKSTVIKVAIDIKPGLTTPAMKANWVKWWRRLIGECTHELEAGQREDKPGQMEPPDDPRLLNNA